MRIFGFFHGEFGQTGTCRIDIRNLRGLFYPIVSGCCPDPLVLRVTGWVCLSKNGVLENFENPENLELGPSPGTV